MKTAGPGAEETACRYRPPLVPHETFVADPPELPVRAPGEQGLSALTRAEVLATDTQGVTLKGTTSDGGYARGAGRAPPERESSGYG